MKRPKLEMKRPKLQMKRPSFQLPKLRPSASINRPKLETPQFLEDLYRDLRDRKLLPVVGVLLVAIVAVPVALSIAGPSAQPSAPTAAIVPAEAPEAQAAVLAENPGLRDYRERLDALKATNPFEQQFEVTGGGGSPAAGGVGGVSGVPSTGSSSTGLPSASSAGSVSSSGGSGTVSTGTSGASTGVGSGSGGSTIDGGGTTKPEIQYFTWRVDLHYGVDGDVQKHEDVKVMDILDPVGVFLGVSEDGGSAVFFISSDVVSAPGEGNCAPTPSDCEMLALQEGQTQQLLYQPEGAAEPTSYRLNLEQIELVPVKKPKAAAVDE